MNRNLDALAGTTFDIVVIGGGITGACIAHDASLRGLSVALVEKRDFGSATSAASSKLLHGGIRYLQQLQLQKVRESAAERAAFLRIAPHLVRWVPFLIPTLGSLSKGRLLLGAGIGAYHLLTTRTEEALTDRALCVPQDRFMSGRELLTTYPILKSLERLTGAWVMHEAQMHSPERMTLAFVKSAARQSAVVANYAAAVRIHRDRSRVTGVEIEDGLTGRRVDVGARVTINAAGPWTGLLNAMLGGARLGKDIAGFSKGIHLVTRSLLDDAAVAIPTRYQNQATLQRGGRHFFIIPWRGCSLIGTTSAPFSGSPDEVRATASDIEGFLADINAVLPFANLTPTDVRHAFAGLYPLTAEVIRPELYQHSGYYQLVDHARLDQIDGFVSALGAKYTTARRLAEQTVDLVLEKLGMKMRKCLTASTFLPGGEIRDMEQYRRSARERHAPLLGAETIQHLLSHYGTAMDDVIALGRNRVTGLSPIAANQPTIEAEVQYAAEHEMALTLEDVVLRRTGLGTIGHPGRAGLERSATIMASVLGWDDARIGQQVAETEKLFMPAS